MDEIISVDESVLRNFPVNMCAICCLYMRRRVCSPVKRKAILLVGCGEDGYLSLSLAGIIT